MKFRLRPWQAEAIIRIHERIRTATRLPRVLAAAPTGTGKGVLACMLRRTLAEEFGGPVAVVSPRVEILYGIADKAGKTARTPVQLQKMGFWTPIRLRNALRRGMAVEYGSLVLDEGHHTIAASWDEVLLQHLAFPCVGLTATPYRGTPKETVRLREAWGEPLILRGWKEAAAAGDLAVPRCAVVPLLDDDEVTVGAGGDFQAASAGDALRERVEALAVLIVLTLAADPRPAIASVPTRKLALELVSRLPSAVAVTQETLPAARQAAFAAVSEGRVAVLVQVAVVSEGVDLPALRIWFDALPTLSPVRWMQALGRVTRPGSLPRYVGTNRNLERHAYLLEGLIPRTAVADAQQGFGGPSARLGVRQLGLEALGRFKAIPIALADGCTAQGFALRAWDEEAQQAREFFALAVPGEAGLIFARRANIVAGEKEDGSRDWKYGRWEACPAPTDLRGYASSPKAWTLSEKQRAWWGRSAGAHGLYPAPPLQARAFQVLPVLADLGRRV